MNAPNSHRRSETANPILFIARRLPRSARASDWRWLDSSILTPIGFVLSSYALNELMARGFLSRSMIWSVLVLMCAPLISILIQLLMRFQSTAMDRIARELRLRPQYVADLMITPLGAPEFVEALWEQHRRRIVTRGGMWSLAMLLLAPIIVASDWENIWWLVMIAAYTFAMSNVMALFPTQAACASACHQLKRMRNQLTGAPLESLSGDRESSVENMLLTGCTSIVLGPLFVGSFSFVLSNFMPDPQSAWGQDGIFHFISLFSFITGGLYYGFMSISAARTNLSENRMSAHFHMDVILEVMREQGWDAK